MLYENFLSTAYIGTKTAWQVIYDNAKACQEQNNSNVNHKFTIYSESNFSEKRIQ